MHVGLELQAHDKIVSKFRSDAVETHGCGVRWFKLPDEDWLAQ
jgi:hypothetical protein